MTTEKETFAEVIAAVTLWRSNKKKMTDQTPEDLLIRASAFIPELGIEKVHRDTGFSYVKLRQGSQATKAQSQGPLEGKQAPVPAVAVPHSQVPDREPLALYVSPEGGQVFIYDAGFGMSVLRAFKFDLPTKGAERQVESAGRRGGAISHKKTA